MIKKILEKQLGKGRIKESVVLAPYTTMKIGGTAEYYFEAQTAEDIVHAIKTAYSHKIPYLLLGGASNVLIDDKGFKGLVMRNLYQKRSVLSEDGEIISISVSSGYPLSKLARETAKEGVAGFEAFFGLPGTVGGALYMNSKWLKGDTMVCVGDHLTHAHIVDKKGNVKKVDHEYCAFEYGKSAFQKTGEIILDAVFLLKKDDAKKLVSIGEDALAYRKQTQPYGVFSSGCFFKNVDGKSAGKMIDDLGLKGYSIGGAKVSDIHANFIVNEGTASSQDIQKLASHIKEKVKKAYGVELETEVIML